VQVQTGRIFVVILTVVAYLVALRAPQSIFDLAVQYAFSGYTALSPLLFAALFWKRSTKWGALAVALWTAFAVIYTARVPGGLAWGGLMPVVPMTLISCALMLTVSLATRPPSPATIARYAFTRRPDRSPAHQRHRMAAD
jgi:Na+/proline symporter